MVATQHDNKREVMQNENHRKVKQTHNLSKKKRPMRMTRVTSLVSKFTCIKQIDTSHPQNEPHADSKHSSQVHQIDTQHPKSGPKLSSTFSDKPTERTH